MTPQEFNNIFQDTIMALETLVEDKGTVYATGNNRAHNFDRAAEILGRKYNHNDALIACRGMWVKQLVSLFDAIEGQPWDQARCDEVIDDLLVYLILTKALFYRAYGWTTKTTVIHEKPACEHRGCGNYASYDLPVGKYCFAHAAIQRDKKQ